MTETANGAISTQRGNICFSHDMTTHTVSPMATTYHLLRLQAKGSWSFQGGMFFVVNFHTIIISLCMLALQAVSSVTLCSLTTSVLIDALRCMACVYRTVHNREFLCNFAASAYRWWWPPGDTRNAIICRYPARCTDVYIGNVMIKWTFVLQRL